MSSDHSSHIFHTPRQAEGGKLHVLVNNSGTNWAEAMETYPLQVRFGFGFIVCIHRKTRLIVPFDLECA